MGIRTFLRGLVLTPDEEDVVETEDKLAAANEALDRLENLLDRVEAVPEDAVLAPVPHESIPNTFVGEKAIPGLFSEKMVKERPLHCRACGRDLMFSNRYKFDAKTGEKVVVLIEGDCGQEGAEYKYPNIAKHDHIVWDGKNWTVNYRGQDAIDGSSYEMSKHLYGYKKVPVTTATMASSVAFGTSSFTVAVPYNGTYSTPTSFGSQEVK